MRIISSFKDYYDNGLSYGIDPNIVYVREKSTIDLDYTKCNQYKLILDAMEYANEALHCVVAFCGKMYPVYEISWGNCDTKYITKYYYSLEALYNAVFSDKFIDFVESTISVGLNNNINTKQRKAIAREVVSGNQKLFKEKYNYSLRRSINPKEYDDMFMAKNIGDDYFRKHKSPILKFHQNNRRDYVLTINPKLYKINFISQIDPINAYQEISMYIGNNLVEQKDPLVNMTDEVKAEIHGFDKWSFRNPGKQK
jgi:hypothetical protein